MAVLSGKNGAVNGWSTLRNWSINDTSSSPKAVASNTKGGTARRNGIRSWTGSSNLYGARPPAMPGEIFTFTGFTNFANGVSGNGLRYTGSAIVDSIAVTWDWSSGAILSQTVNFSGNGALTPSMGAAITDASAPNLPAICGLIAEMSMNGTDWSTINDLTQGTLTISAANPSYVNSDTNCMTGRTAGSIDYAVSLSQQDETRVSYLFDIDDIIWLRLGVTLGAGEVDPTSWVLKYGKVESFSNIMVDVETQAIIARTIAVNMSADDGAGNIGYILRPGDAASAPWWGKAAS